MSERKLRAINRLLISFNVALAWVLIIVAIVHGVLPG